MRIRYRIIMTEAEALPKELYQRYSTSALPCSRRRAVSTRRRSWSPPRPYRKRRRRTPLVAERRFALRSRRTPSLCATPPVVHVAGRLADRLVAHFWGVDNPTRDIGQTRNYSERLRRDRGDGRQPTDLKLVHLSPDRVPRSILVAPSCLIFSLTLGLNRYNSAFVQLNRVRIGTAALHG